MGTDGPEQPAHTPSWQDVLTALETLPLPSLPFMIAEEMDFQRRGETPRSESSPVPASTVLQLLRELEREPLVKGHTLPQWEDLGIRVWGTAPIVLGLLGDAQQDGRALEESEKWAAFGLDSEEPANLIKLWWPVNRWRDAQAAGMRRYREVDRRKAALQVAEQARRHSPVRDAVDSVLRERERRYKSRKPFDDPQGG